MDKFFIEKARVFATAAHAAVKQKRKYTGDDYINHPARVAAMVESVGGTPEMIAAAWLHDVVEDTGVTQDLIREEFGSVVAFYVMYLTNPSKPEDGNRAVRKEIDRKFIANAPAEVKTIKLADLIDNTDSIVQHDPNFAEVYLKEKRALLEVLQEGDQRLLEVAKNLI